MFRSHPKGGKAVYLKNSLRGQMAGHSYHIFQINVIDGKETLGEEIGDCPTLDKAIDLASTF